MYRNRSRVFYFGDFNITPREILASIVIIFIMLSIGVRISQGIEKLCEEHAEKIITSTQINDNPTQFEHSMKVSQGNCLIYSTLQTLDPVECFEYGGQYTKVKKIYEVYTKHTRTVTKTDSKGKSYTTTETYYTWDTKQTWENSSTTQTFCGKEFPSGMVYDISMDYLGTEKISSKKRYQYYGSPVQISGTLFANLTDNNLKDLSFYKNQTIENTIERAQKEANGVGYKIAFWFVWIIVIGFLCYGFYYLENNWLE